MSDTIVNFIILSPFIIWWVFWMRSLIKIERLLEEMKWKDPKR